MRTCTLLLASLTLLGCGSAAHDGTRSSKADSEGTHSSKAGSEAPESGSAKSPDDDGGATRPDPTQDTPKADTYPDHWWAPVEGGKSWEVLPQAGERGKSVVLSKRHELGILSNFADTPFELDGVKYASVEGLWQAMKYPEGPDDPRAQHEGAKWEHTRAEVAALTGFTAYRAGKKARPIMKAMGIDWVTYQGKRMRYRVAGKDDADAHYDVIYRASLAKVRQNEKVKTILLSTGDLTLLPDHKQREGSPAAYRYYEIYMKIRALLRSEGE